VSKKKFELNARHALFYLGRNKYKRDRFLGIPDRRPDVIGSLMEKDNRSQF